MPVPEIPASVVEAVAEEAGSLVRVGEESASGVVERVTAGAKSAGKSLVAGVKSVAANPAVRKGAAVGAGLALAGAGAYTALRVTSAGVAAAGRGVGEAAHDVKAGIDAPGTEPYPQVLASGVTPQDTQNAQESTLATLTSPTFLLLAAAGVIVLILVLRRK